MYQSAMVVGFAVPALAGLILAENVLLPAHNDGLIGAATEISKGARKVELQITKETCLFLETQYDFSEATFQVTSETLETPPTSVQIDASSGEVYLNGDPLSGSGGQALLMECQKLL